MRRLLPAPIVLTLATTTVLTGQQPPTPPSFRSGVALVLVDAVVRDRNGALVTGLTADDFDLFEDGARQQILTFAYEEVTPHAAPITNAAALTAGAGGTATATVPPPSSGVHPPAGASTATASDTPTGPLTSDEVAGPRVLTLVLHTRSMPLQTTQTAR